MKVSGRWLTSCLVKRVPSGRTRSRLHQAPVGRETATHSRVRLVWRVAIGILRRIREGRWRGLREPAVWVWSRELGLRLLLVVLLLLWLRGVGMSGGSLGKMGGSAWEGGVRAAKGVWLVIESLVIHHGTDTQERTRTSTGRTEHTDRHTLFRLTRRRGGVG